MGFFCCSYIHYNSPALFNFDDRCKVQTKDHGHDIDYDDSAALILENTIHHREADLVRRVKRNATSSK
jgi:hypothetical protein